MEVPQFRVHSTKLLPCNFSLDNKLLSITIFAYMDEGTQKEANSSKFPEAYLHVQRGPLTGTIIQLPAGVHEFGREDGHILPDEHVSRRHARIIANSGEYVLTDLDSSNGTVVNGQQVAGPVLLHNGDIIRLGGTIMGFYIRGIQGDIVPGTGALTPATKSTKHSETTILIRNSRKNET